jgi:TetR/AcrR family transcriptional regulator
MATQTVRRRRTADAILTAAEKVFRAGGYPGATMEAIAREADVAVATLYDHFGGKRDVYLALADRMLDLNEMYLEAGQEGVEDPVKEAVAIGKAYARFHLDHPLAFRLIGLVGVVEKDTDRIRAARSRIRRRQAAMLDQLAKALSRAMRAGQLRRRDPKRVALVLWASLNGVLAAADRGMLPRKEVEPSLQMAIELALNGLR